MLTNCIVLNEPSAGLCEVTTTAQVIAMLVGPRLCLHVKTNRISMCCSTRFGVDQGYVDEVGGPLSGLLHLLLTLVQS